MGVGRGRPGVRVVSAALHSNRRADKISFIPRRGLVVTHLLLRRLGMSQIRITSTQMSRKRFSTMGVVYS